MQSMRTGLEDCNREVQGLWRSAATKKDFELMGSQLESKASVSEMNEQLGLKANKQSVANALHRKANRADMDALLIQKAEVTELETLRAIVEVKTDDHKFDQAISQLLEIKADKGDI